MSLAQYAFPHEDSESLNQFYGNPRGRNGLVSQSWYKENIVKWEPPYLFFFSEGHVRLRTLLVHRLCVPTFDKAFSDVLKHFGPSGIDQHRLNICGGTYNFRAMRGGSRLSVHAYGIAVDMDPQHNPFPHPWTSHGINIDFVNILQEAGFWWRGYHGDIDPMHFQCTYRGQKPADVPVVPPIVVANVANVVVNVVSAPVANVADEIQTADTADDDTVIEVKTVETIDTIETIKHPHHHPGNTQPVPAPHPAVDPRPIAAVHPEDNSIPGRIYNFFTANGLTKEQACGVVANVQAESGFDINNVGDGGLARGLFQMHPDRRNVIWDGAKHDMKHGDIEEQCKGALWELQHVELHAYGKLKEAETPYQAGYNWCRYYERPASHLEWIKRGRIAEKWYHHFNPS